MKYGVRKTSRYKKSIKKMLKRGKDIKKLANVVLKLANGEQLPPKNNDHPLSGDLAGLRDCHIENDLQKIVHKHLLDAHSFDLPPLILNSGNASHDAHIIPHGIQPRQ